jgi:glutathione S-transferase
MLRIHGVPRSRAFRCIWAAEEAGQPYEIVPVGFDGAMKTESYRAVNPNRTIPALQDGDLVLFESLAINLHIAGKAGPPLMPRGDDASRALQWTLWAATEVEPNIMQWAYNAFMRPPEQRDSALAAAGAEATRKRLAVLEQTLADRPFLLGKAFTIADCNIAGVLYGSWANGFDFGAFPRVKTWLESCLTRPAALKARKLREG